MIKKIDLNKKETKWMLFVLAILLVVASYYLIYSKNRIMASQIYMESNQLQIEINELSAKEAEQEVKISEMENMKEEIELIMSEFPKETTIEKCIMILEELCQQTDLEISSQTFTMNEVFYRGEENITSSEQVEVIDENVKEIKPSLNRIGYKSTVAISYRTTYSGLKKAVDFINNYEEKMELGTINIFYDTDNHMVNGDMTIYFYSLSIEGEEKELVFPDVEIEKIGLDNIFEGKDKRKNIKQNNRTEDKKQKNE